MIQRTSVLTKTLIDAMEHHARTVGPMSAEVTLRIVDLLRFFMLQAADMERRLAGEELRTASAGNVISLFQRHSQRGGSAPEGDA